MSRSFILSSALFALSATAQTSTTFTDANTGITFRGYKDATSGYTLGFALPENPTTDFIAQIQAPIDTKAGWAGFSMAQSMVGNLLVVAWPNDGEIVSSFREASGYTSPSIKTGDFSMSPIPDGTFVNDTAYSYTFLCSNCLSDDPSNGMVIAPELNIMGWAFSKDPVTTPASASSALSYHNGGFGAFGITMDDAKSADFDKWAALAVPSTPGNGGNSTVPGNGGNSTTPIGVGNNTAIVANATYDYIVAGAGTAGLVAAARLAESGSSVLVLERGGPSLASSGNDNTLTWNNSVTMYDVPGLGYYLSDVGSPAYCTDTADQAGCLLGGSSSVNAMMFVNPQKRDFDDAWPTGWKWSDVSTAAERLAERNPGQTYGSEDGQRYNDEAYNVLSKFFAAEGWAETDFVKDPHSKVDVFGHPTWNVVNGLRAGPVRTYLPHVQSLSNFKLEMNTQVVRAVREGAAVSGVEVQNADGERVIYNVKDGGKVILAAGAMSTPRILFNSGIGPSEQLNIVASGTNAGTLPKESDWIDLPVGAEIRDHPIFTVTFKTSSPMAALAKTAFTNPDQTNIDLFAKGSGLLAQAGQRLNWWTSVKTSSGKEVFFQGTCTGPSNNTIQMKIYATHGTTSMGSLGITAEGATTLTEKPLMNSDDDKEAATLMMERLIKMSKTSNSTLIVNAPTGVSNVTAADLIKTFQSGLHYVSTAKMGTKGEAGVVVDTNTKVYGTDNLFVVDASMHPDLPTGNTQAIVMVAAEAAVARILALGGGSGNGTTPVKPEESVSTPVPTLPVSTGAPIASSTTVPPVSSAAPTGTAPVETPPASSPAVPEPSTPAPGGEAAQNWQQCGGKGFTGPSKCAEGLTCIKQNDYYSQCLSSRSRRENTASFARRSRGRLGMAGTMQS